MNSKSVLSKIMTLLSLENEVNFTDAQTKDGTILQSPTFDVGEDVEVVAEDGSKTLAPDGEHEIALKDSEGNEVIIKIITKDGKIVERENVELVDEEVVDKEAEIEDEAEIEMADATTETAEGLPNTTEESKSNEVKEGEPTGDPIISLGYRIDEMEKIISKMKEKLESAYPEEGAPEVSSLDPTELAAEEDEEEDLPKLDGAPLDTKLSSDHLHTPNNYGKKTGSPQGTFLSKLYR